MKLQDQVCTLEQAKRLKELGVNAPSQFWYSETKAYSKGRGFVDIGLQLQFLGDKAEFIDTEHYSAYTAAELGNALPDDKWAVPYRYGKIDTNSDVFTVAHITITKRSIGYETTIVTIDGHVLDSTRYHSMAHSMANVLIYLLENNLITPDQVNQSI